MRADRYLRLGLEPGLRPPEEAASYPLTAEQRRYLEGLSHRQIDGDPETVRSGILQAGKDFGTTDIGVVTNCYSFEDRLRSFQTLAQAFWKKPAAVRL
jgi:hypothetical protein